MKAETSPTLQPQKSGLSHRITQIVTVQEVLRTEKAPPNEPRTGFKKNCFDLCLFVARAFCLKSDRRIQVHRASFREPSIE